MISHRKIDYISHFRRVYQLHDEPKMFHYSSTVDFEGTDGNSRMIRATGASFESDKEAYIKCVGEAIERYQCAYYKNKWFTKASYKEIDKPALDPMTVVGMSDKQKKEMPYFDIDHETPINWIESFDEKNKKVLIPASLVFFNYKLTDGEKFVYRPISTGAAGYTDKKTAIRKGYIEAVERDAYTLAYFSRYQAPRVDFDSIKDKRVAEILDMLRRYRLGITSLDLTNDLGVPVFVSVVTDDTGKGPATLVGLGAGTNPMTALISSMEESVRARSWIRLAKAHRKEPLNEIMTAEERGLYWYDRKMRKHLDFWLNSSKTTTVKDEEVEIEFRKYFWVDLSPKELDYHVVKVIVPELNPHCISERHIPKGGKRYKKINNPNKVPNPFI